MRIVEVCPECGADIISESICTCPPIPIKRCTKCNWKWEGEQEETLRVPFNPNGYENISVPVGNYTLKIPIINELVMKTDEKGNKI